MDVRTRAAMGLGALGVVAAATGCFVADSIATPYGEDTVASGILPTEGADAAAPRCATDAPFVREEVFYEDPNHEVFGARLLPDESEAFATVFGADKVWKLAAIRPGSPPDVTRFRLGRIDEAGYPTVTADGAVMFFTLYDQVVDNQVRGNIYVSRRRADGIFDGASQVPIATDSDESTPYVTPSGDALYFTRWEGRSVIHRIELPAVALTEMGALDPASAPPGDAWNPVVTADELTLFFASANAKGDLDIWMATHSKKGERFKDAHVVAELRSPAEDVPSWISPDGCVLYFDRYSSDLRAKVMRAFRF